MLRTIQKLCKLDRFQVFAVTITKLQDKLAMYQHTAVGFYILYLIIY